MKTLRHIAPKEICWDGRSEPTFNFAYCGARMFVTQRAGTLDGEMNMGYERGREPKVRGNVRDEDPLCPQCLEAYRAAAVVKALTTEPWMRLVDPNGNKWGSSK